MAAEWFYAKSKQKVGPVTLEQLKELVRSGELGPRSMVWKQGMAKWMEASQVEGLFESSPSKEVPPPLPPTATPLPVAEWYFIKDGQQHGPVTAEQLRASITHSDLVWRAGLTQWVAASTIPGLFPGASQPVPPIPPPIPGASKSKPAERAFKPAQPSSTEEILEVLPADQDAPAPRLATHRVTGEMNLVGRNGWGTDALHIILDGEEIGTKSWIDGIHHLQFESTLGHHTVTLRNGDSEDNAKSYPVEFRKPGHYTLTFTTGWFLQEFPTGIESSYSPQALAPLPVPTVRRKMLCGSWQSIAESHQGVEFTEDGAVLFSDGSAGRFMARGKTPNEAIEMEIVNGQFRQFKIISLTPTQLIVAEGNETRTFRRAGSKQLTPKRATDKATKSGINDLSAAMQVAPQAIAIPTAESPDKKFAESMAHVRQANRHRRVGEWDQAIHESSVAINLFPKNYVAYFERGLALNGKGNVTGDSGIFAAAVGDVTTAIEIGIDDPGALGETYYNRGCILTDDLGRHAEAIEDFHRTLELDPGNDGALRGLQRAQAAAENDDGGPAEVNRLVPNDPANLAVVHAERGMGYHKKGDDVRALAEFKEAHRLDPNREDFRKSLAALHGNLAMQYAHNKDWAQAKAECEKAVQLDPDTITYRECLNELDSALQGAGAEEEEVGQQESFSSAGASPSPPVKKREPGMWHRIKSALSPNTDKCPNCGENLAGEDEGTELIDREQGIQTRMKVDETYHGSGQPSRTFREEQVIVYHDTYRQYLKCKFCDHEWREKRETTYQP